MSVNRKGIALLILFSTVFASGRSKLVSSPQDSATEISSMKITMTPSSAMGSRTEQRRALSSSDANKPKQQGIAPPGKRGCIGNCYSLTQQGGSHGLGVFYSLTTAETVLHSFNGGTMDGEFPNGDLVQDAKGNYYGTTQSGGASGCGAVFVSDSAGNESLVYSFQLNSADGCGSVAGLIFDSAGNLFGTTGGGGATGNGTVFELNRSPTGGWTEKVLYSFCSLRNCADGSVPESSLVVDNSGNIFGTTVGGTGGGNFGTATIFELSPDGHGGYIETTIYHNDTGDIPSTAVVLYNGFLYGTTERGGIDSCPSFLYRRIRLSHGCGQIYKLSPKPTGGWGYAVIYKFSRFDGAFPTGNLIVDQAGNLFGTTSEGGIPGICKRAFDNYGCGTVFKLAQDGTFTTIYRFAGGTDGAIPTASLAMDASGDLFGTTQRGGGSGCSGHDGCGTVFELVPQGGSAWTELILNRFTGSNGALPTSGLKFSN